MGTHLRKRHILRQPLPDILHPLSGEAEGAEVCHQPTHTMLHHECGQHVLGVAQQQVEGDVQLCTLLQGEGKVYGMVCTSADPAPSSSAEEMDLPTPFPVSRVPPSVDIPATAVPRSPPAGPSA